MEHSGRALASLPAVRRQGRPRSRSGGARRAAVGLVVVTALSGCLGDPPPDPEVQPLEIVVGGTDPEFGPCSLNVEEVGAGTHDVVPVAMGGTATVRILDPSGAAVFERTVDTTTAEGGGFEVDEQDEGTVRLEEGEHRVECVLPDGTSSAELLVVPARPGVEEDDGGG